MKLTFLAQTFFPFLVPEKDSSFAASVGPQTVYPAGFSLDRALQIYWRAQNYQLSAAGNGTLGSITQALTINGPLPPRNASVGTGNFYEVDGLTPMGPGDLVAGLGLRTVVPGGGTITASGTDGGTNNAAVFDLLVDLFYPENFVPDPVVNYAGQWWPAMSLSCSVQNTVETASGGEMDILYDCTTYDPGSTTEIGSFSFFGVAVPVFCNGLAPASGPDPAETRTFSGSLMVQDEWA